uniref:exodeoxyribonuclease III n=1 Tax=Sander lucioperca TaxID=283035 RepID=A0A8D0AIX9_SANLU
ITEGASQLTGFTVKKGQLYLHESHVRTVSLFSALKSFIKFLSYFRGPVLLAAHNAMEFDALVLTRLMRKRFFLWNRFQQVVSGFVDTFILSKNVYPRHLYPGIKYSQKSLVNDFLRKSYDAHDALEDAKMLEELFNFWDPNNWDVADFEFLFQFQHIEYLHTFMILFSIRCTVKGALLCYIYCFSLKHKSRFPTNPLLNSSTNYSPPKLFYPIAFSLAKWP